MTGDRISRRGFLGRVGRAVCGAGLAGLAGCAEQARGSGGPRRPNIVLIFIDDLGWPAVSCFGNEHVRTRHIDRLAAEGMQFTSAYVTPQCTPSRASLLTGQHTARNRMWHVIPKYEFPHARLKEPEYRENLPRDTFTLGKALQGAGYKTACIGKWHLTTNPRDGYYLQLRPAGAVDFGFDYVPDRYEDKRFHQKGDKGVDLLTDQAIDFMRANRDDPFFLYLSHHTIHGPVLAPESLARKYRDKGYPAEGMYNATYLAAIEHLDRSVGRLLAALDEMKLADDTVVMFLSDNGGVDQRYKDGEIMQAFANTPLRYGKGSPYEGGIRVPMIVRWPGVVKPQSVCDTPVHVVDVYPTFVEVAGGKLPEPGKHILDGVSLAPLLRGRGGLGRDALYFHMPLYDALWGATPCGVIRQGDWKLLEFFGDYVDREDDYRYLVGPRVELYNLKDDIGETRNLARSHPEKTNELLGQLRRWRQSVDAPMPTLNPAFDPDRAMQR